MSFASVTPQPSHRPFFVIAPVHQLPFLLKKEKRCSKSKWFYLVLLRFDGLCLVATTGKMERDDTRNSLRVLTYLDYTPTPPKMRTRFLFQTISRNNNIKESERGRKRQESEKSNDDISENATVNISPIQRGLDAKSFDLRRRGKRQPVTNSHSCVTRARLPSCMCSCRWTLCESSY